MLNFIIKWILNMSGKYIFFRLFKFKPTRKFLKNLKIFFYCKLRLIELNFICVKIRLILNELKVTFKMIFKIF